MADHESTEEIELTEEDQRDLEQMFSEADGKREWRSILEIWREVLAPAETEMAKPVSPEWANRIVQQYQQIQFKDMNLYRDLYYSGIMEMAHIVKLEIEEDSEALNVASPQEDAEQNSVHYKNILMNWQKTILAWELGWRCTSETAAVELAMISEVHKMFFGETGLTAHLGNIKFEFDEADQANLREALDELRDALLGVSGE